MTSVVNYASNVTNNVVNYFSSANSFNILGQDKEILNIGNILNSILLIGKDISIPRLAVVGSQSG